MEENDYRMFLQNGKIFPVLDINSLDDADIMDKLERVVESTSTWGRACPQG
jgi:hypothetical protein